MEQRKPTSKSQQRQFTVTPETAGFINALDALEYTKNAYCSALFNYYGDETGERLYNDDLALFDAITATIARRLTLSMSVNMGVAHDLNAPLNV